MFFWAFQAQSKLKTRAVKCYAFTLGVTAQLLLKCFPVLPCEPVVVMHTFLHCQAKVEECYPLCQPTCNVISGINLDKRDETYKSL